MNKIFFVIKITLFLLLNTPSYALSSSSYLIANSAVFLYDYDYARSYYESNDLDNFSLNDLNKKLLVFINSNSINKGVKVAKKILKKDEKNIEAWAVYLSNAKKYNLKHPFIEFNLAREKNNLDFIDYIFYQNSKLKKNNKDISNSILNVVLSNSTDQDNNINNYDYYIFYLCLSIFLDNQNSEAHFYIAQIYQKLKNYNKAEIYYNKINSNHKLYFESQKNIAINKQFINNFKEAVESLNSLLEIYPHNIDLIIHIADFYRSNKKYNKAINYYSQLIEYENLDNEKIWQILFKRGICYERINNWKLAEKDFLQSLDINPDSPQVLNYLGYGWIERDIFLDKSLEMLKIAYEKFPESHYILDSLAWAHYKKNHLTIASELMEEVILRAPGEAISLDHLGDIYFAMGRKREAIYMWKQAKDLAKPEDNIINKILTKLQNNAG